MNLESFSTLGASERAAWVFAASDSEVAALRAQFPATRQGSWSWHAEILKHAEQAAHVLHVSEIAEARTIAAAAAERVIVDEYRARKSR